MLSLIEKAELEQQRIPSMEHCLGKGLMMPFNNTNSGPRAIMHSTQLEHALNLINPSVPLVGTGYETLFGEYSSTFIKAECDYEVLAKISKFRYAPDQNYYLIVKRLDTGEFDVIERIPYKYITEEYGILYNNDYIDKLAAGAMIRKEDTIIKSTAYDDVDNRQDGRDLNVTYMSCERNKEDSIIISDEAAEMLAVPLIKKVPIQFNDNDIPLNLYGSGNIYKSFPDVNEEVKNGIICGVRRERKEQSLFAQSIYRLSSKLMSDNKYVGKGEVIDINVYCNNTDLFNNYFNSQIKFYHDQNIIFMQEFVQAVKPIIDSGAECTYDLRKMYYNCSKILSGGQYIKEKVYSGILVELVILERKSVEVGDKLTNRFGGKGCVSIVRPKHLMPRMDNGEYIHMIYNSSGCVNRENVGQLFELSLNFIGGRLADYMKSGALSLQQSIDLYLNYLYTVSPIQAEETRKFLNSLDDTLLQQYVDELMNEGIHLSNKPISESMTIDKLRFIYKNLPFDIKQYKLLVPQRDSNGGVRYIESRRRMVCGKMYIYRLKQYSEEKFSVTSLSSTNIQNQNTRSQSKKQNKTIHNMNPTKFGEMETGDLAHMGTEVVVNNLLIVSASPHARRLCEKLLTGNPFDINVQVDENCTNRGAETLNTYLFTAGLRLKFIKKPRKILNPLVKIPLIPCNIEKPLMSLRKAIFATESQHVEYVEPKSIRPALVSPALVSIKDNVRRNLNE